VTTSVAGGGDLVFDGEKLWWLSGESLIALDAWSGTLIRNIACGQASGVAWHQGLLCVCSDTARRLRAYDPLSGNLVWERPTSGLALSLPVSEGSTLVAVDGQTASLVRYDPETGAVERLGGLGGIRPSGLCLWGGELLLTEGSREVVTRMTLTGQALEVYRSPLQGTSGICTLADGLTLVLGSRHGELAQVRLP